MISPFVLALIGVMLAVEVATAQTATTQSAPTATTSSATTTTSGGGTTTTNPNAGAFDKLSPGNQKIAQALFDAQKASGAPPRSRLSLDDIAAMKLNGQGWGNVFKELKAKGLVAEKNLGQVVSKYQRQQRGTTPGRVATTGGATGAKAGATSGTAARGQGGRQDADKSTGATITSGSNQTSAGERGQGPRGAEGGGGNGEGRGITTGISGSHGGGAAPGAGVTSGGGHSGGGQSGGSHGRGK